MRRWPGIFLLLVLLGGCDGPWMVFPGGELGGEVVTEPVADWSFVQAPYVDLEVRPANPYSVTLNYVIRDGELFIDPADGRTWFEYLKQDLNVRVRFGQRIYPVRAVLVAGPGELPGFDTDRWIYRLESR